MPKIRKESKQKKLMKKTIFIFVCLSVCMLCNAQTYFYVPVDKDPSKGCDFARVVHFFSSSKISYVSTTTHQIRERLMINENAYGDAFFEHDRNRDVYYNSNDMLNNLNSSNSESSTAAKYGNNKNGYNYYYYYFMAAFYYGHYQQRILCGISDDKSSLVEGVQDSKPVFYRRVSADDFFPSMNF